MACMGHGTAIMIVAKGSHLGVDPENITEKDIRIIEGCEGVNAAGHIVYCDALWDPDAKPHSSVDDTYRKCSSCVPLVQFRSFPLLSTKPTHAQLQREAQMSKASMGQ